MSSSHEFIKKCLSLFTVQALCAYTSLICGEHEHFITIRGSDADKKEQFQQKWVAPRHRVPIIQCDWDQSEKVRTTLMFITDAYRRVDHSSHVGQKRLKLYEEVLRDHIPPNPTALQNGALSDDVIGVIMCYLGRPDPKMLNSGEASIWIAFKEHIATPSLLPGINILNPTEFYKTCLGNEKYILSEEWLKDAHHNIIKTHLNILATMQHYNNPYAFTTSFEILNINDNRDCSKCYAPHASNIEETETSWLEVSVSNSDKQDFAREFDKTYSKKVSCTSCKQLSTVWCTKKITQYPKLLIILLLPKNQSCKARLPEKCTLGEESFSLCSSLGQSIGPNNITPYIIYHDKNISFYDTIYHDSVHQGSDDQPLAAMYKLIEQADEASSETSETSPNGGCCLVS